MKIISKIGIYGATIKIVTDTTTVEETVENPIKKQVPQELIDELLSASYAFSSYNKQSPVELLKNFINGEMNLKDTEIEELKQYLDTL